MACYYTYVLAEVYVITYYNQSALQLLYIHIYTSWCIHNCQSLGSLELTKGVNKNSIRLNVNIYCYEALICLVILTLPLGNLTSTAREGVDSTSQQISNAVTNNFILLAK